VRKDRLNRGWGAVLALFCAGVVQCDSGPAAGDDLADVVMTTFYPTKFFAHTIAGDIVRVECPVPDGEDPIFWQPSRAILQRYQKASLIILNGAEFEKWVENASLPKSRMVDASESFKDSFITFEKTTHSHGLKGEHTHEGVDGHIWLDPLLAKAQVESIEKALARTFPDFARHFARNSRSLRENLDLLDRRLGEITSRVKEAQLFASHPAYNYLARRYGWTVINLDLSPDETPGDEDLVKLEQAPATAGKRIILWESAPLESTVEKLEARFQAESVVFSPCELLDQSLEDAGEDFLSVMIKNIESLALAVR